MHQSNANIWCENRTWHVYTYLTQISSKRLSILFAFLSFILYFIVTFPLRPRTRRYMFSGALHGPPAHAGSMQIPLCRGTRRGSSLLPSRYFFHATLFQPFPISDSNRKIVSCLIVKLMAAPRVRRGAHCNFEISSQINFPTETKLMRIYTHSLVDWKFVRNIDSMIVCSNDIGSKIFQSTFNL